MTTNTLDLYWLCTALWSLWGYFFIFLSKSEELRAETFNSFPGPWTRTLIFRILFFLFGTRSPLFLFSWLEPFILHFDELANLIIKLSLYNFILQSTCCTSLNRHLIFLILRRRTRQAKLILRSWLWGPKLGKCNGRLSGSRKSLCRYILPYYLT